jgi:hypothetical protein
MNKGTQILDWYYDEVVMHKGTRARPPYRTPYQRSALHHRLRDEVYSQLEGLPTAQVDANTIAGSYPVLPGLLAGEYPAQRYDDDPARLSAFLDAGIRHFIDLTEQEERSFSSRPLYPYEPLLDMLATQRRIPISYQRFAIADRSAPSQGQMRHILDAVDVARATTQGVYVHCMGGVGRTGAVIGCYLVRHGTTPEDALRLIARRLYYTHKAERLSPEVDEQRALVLRWQSGT